MCCGSFVVFVMNADFELQSAELHHYSPFYLALKMATERKRNHRSIAKLTIGWFGIEKTTLLI